MFAVTGSPCRLQRKRDANDNLNSTVFARSEVQIESTAGTKCVTHNANSVVN